MQFLGDVHQLSLKKCARQNLSVNGGGFLSEEWKLIWYVRIIKISVQIAFYGKSSVVLTFAQSTVGDHHHQELIFARFLTGIKVPYRVVRPVSLSSLPQRFESFSALVRY